MNKTEAIQALGAAIKQGNEVLNQLKESEQEKLEPLTFEACTALVKNNLIVLSNTVSNIMLDHSEIEKLYQYSLKAQGK